MLEEMRGKEFKYKKLSEKEQKQRGILGRLIGPCADFINPTRNGRGYNEQLWENVFNNDIMKEKIQNRVALGELGHPTNRSEVDIEKVAICLAEVPKKGDDGNLYGVFDILSTPNGKILKALCDYGCKIGISSRGEGDVDDLDNTVDPDTYDCECFDAVLVPAVKEARLKYVTEDHKGGKKLNLKQALAESLKNASDSERKVMMETLDTLKLNTEDQKSLKEEVEDLDVEDIDNEEEIEVEEVADEEVNVEEVEDEDADIEVEDDEDAVEDEEINKEEIFLDFLANNFDEEQVRKVCKLLDIDIEGEENDEDEDAEEGEEEDEEASNVEETPDEDIDVEEEETDEIEDEDDVTTDDGTKAIVDSLKEALKTRSDLENNMKSLQEKLAVSDAKVNEIKEECGRFKEAVARLSVLAKSSRDLKRNVSELEESLKQKTAVISTQRKRITRLAESSNNSAEKTKLTEQVNAKANEVKDLTKTLTTTQAKYKAKITALNNQLVESNESKKLEESKSTALTESVAKVTNLKESYRKLANKAVSKYIEIKSDTLGLTSADVKRKLGESYTIEDVDQICEDLKQYQLNVSKLPFSLDKKIGIRVNESKSNNVLNNTSRTGKHVDDEVDESLVRLANFE